MIAGVGVALQLVGCSAPPKVFFTDLMDVNGQMIPGYSYTVQRGDTLASIAARYGCAVELLAQINQLRPDEALGAGQRVFIPRTRTAFTQQYYSKRKVALPGSVDVGANLAQPPVYRRGATSSLPIGASERWPASLRRASSTAQAGGIEPPTQQLPGEQPASLAFSALPTADSGRKGIEIAQNYNKRRLPASSQALVPGAPRFQWPVEGKITSTFNSRSSGKRLHMGIDIAAPRGTPVRAAYSGRILYSDSSYLPSMGNMVIIEHVGGWITLYAHNDRNAVKEGQHVEVGQIIAYVGATGNATGTHVHFEIRKNADTPVDPLFYLPAIR